MLSISQCIIHTGVLHSLISNHALIGRSVFIVCLRTCLKFGLLFYKLIYVFILYVVLTYIYLFVFIRMSNGQSNARNSLRYVVKYKILSKEVDDDEHSSLYCMQTLISPFWVFQRWKRKEKWECSVSIQKSLYIFSVYIKNFIHGNALLGSVTRDYVTYKINRSWLNQTIIIEESLTTLFWTSIIYHN